MSDQGRPPQYGQRLLNAVVDERAANGHERPYASIPKSSTVSDGFRDISYATLANAVNRCAHWLVESFGKPGDKNTIAYIGPSDMRYQLLSLGAVKSGHVVGTSYRLCLHDADEVCDRCSTLARETLQPLSTSSSMMLRSP